MNRHMHQVPNLQGGYLDRAAGAIERGAQLYAAAKTVYQMGKGLAQVGRYAAPLLLAA